ncbi:uncharacterized protein LOC117590619 [Drosophila guanche]|uniref:G/T mismatch-specific thymine DNA glycosylase n=1 Tax=Drosophila guanche TaxID=7266 RepID=A0A3B0KT33_DROGU|nr:uncharacterized protein LOC117590619 [Drosophila guanche]XP_034139312.1 uncharacterized protein LOC117590619 [Drosophila guanche]XP_034139313.1 uncharacterized protein LOC117590619 [Drosophila guanche]SPP89016.1 blast:G/T mismatch-specific thymine DNA glycosylase [Drosophila guanche]
MYKWTFNNKEMQVESLLPEKIPLISSSFTNTPKVAPIFLRRLPTQENISSAGQEDLIKVLQVALINLSIQQRIRKLTGIEMASTEDGKLGTETETVSATVAALESNPYSSSANGNSSKGAGRSNNCKRQKFCGLAETSNRSNVDFDDPIQDPDVQPEKSVGDSDKSQHQSGTVKEAQEEAQSVSILDSSSNCGSSKSTKKTVGYDNTLYIAPEQALVTSVELVVPAPQPATVRLSEQPSSGSVGDSSLINSNKLQYNSAAVYNATGSSNSTRSLANDKIDGCVNDSSNLNVRNPTNLALAAATGDILLADRRTSIWAPHDDEQVQATTPETTTPDDTKQGSELPYRTVQQQRHSELLLQIEKEGSEAVEALPLALKHHHDNSTQVQYGQQQILDSQLHSNMYAQMMQQQHHQHSQIILDQNSRHQQHASYSSYGSHFQHSGLFGAHQGSDHHRQQQQELPHHMEMECHGHLHQPASTVQQQQQQLNEAYHDLIMEDFHEDPSSAYKLTLSPGNVKPENQDDGYETSAGDVLTPNSHSSSTHSATPQHQMQHPNIGLMQLSQNKTEDMVSSQITVALEAVPDGPSASSTNGNQAQAPPPLPHLAMAHSQSVNSRGSSNANAAGVDPYSFMGEEMRMLSPVNRHIEDVASNAANYATIAGSLSVPNGNPECSGGDIYQLQHQLPHSQQQPHNSEPYNDTDKVKSNDNSNCGLPSKPTPKKRGRKKKLLTDGDAMQMATSVSQQGNCAANSGDDPAGDSLLGMKPKERKKHDRFNGMSEAEVIKRTIPDHLCDNLDIVIVGINPGLFAAYKGHHYAGPGNHFWKCLYLAGLTQEQMSADEDHKLLNLGIGFTNMVARATKGSADLTRKEIKEGSRILLEKLQRFRPKVAVFNGKLIFEVFSGKKEFHFGRQPDRVDGTDTYIWVMPSSSARCAQLPRAADKVPFYAALKKFRDFLNGLIPNIDESECVFTDQRIRQCSEQQQLQQHQQTDVNITIHPHVDQQAGLIFADGSGGGGSEGGSIEGSSQISEKLLPHMAPNLPSPNSVIERGTFAYTGGDNTIRNAPNTTSLGENNYLFGHQQGLPQQPQEKKKRGRPKKVKGQDMTDSSTASKIAMSSQQMAHHDFNNIMNLSMIAGAINPEIPKKKRGRPKKLKPTIDNIIPAKQQQHQHTNTNPNSQSAGLSAMHPVSMEHVASSSPQSNHQMPPNLYNTPPPSHLLYTASASPMASPALNCNYTQVHGHGTPPVGQSVSAAHGTTPPILDQQNDHMLTQKQSQPMGMGIRDQPHLGETPPPNSPNICSAVDFDQPDDNSDGQGREQTQGQAQEQILGIGQQHTQVVDKAQYVSPDHEADAIAVPSQDHYQQWISPHTHLGQKQILQQMQQQPQPLQYHQEHQEHWQRYEDQNPYLLISPHHQLEQSPQLGNMPSQNPSTSVQIVSDVARKSLSGLESLVDQIPAIREHDSSTIPPATAAAAAAAVESRLLGLQQQKRCHQDSTVQAESCGSANDVSNVLNNNFSVSNLAASAATTDNVTAYTSRAENRDNSEHSNNSHNNCSTSNEYAIHSPTGYPHNATHLITSALGATINSSEAHPHPHPHTHPHPHPHPQMYMDHAHITSHMAHMSPVNVNSVYAPTAYGSHPQHGTGPGEYATAHGHYGLGSPAQATGPGSTPTLHVPSPNYPYAHHPYGHTPTQTNYPTYGHAHTHHNHPTHHLSVFDRLKPSDISGYGGF